MKYYVSSRQSPEYSAKANGVKVQWRDRESIFDLYEKYPNLERVSLDLPWSTEDINWKTIENYNILGQGKFILCLGNLIHAVTAKEKNIPFCYGYQIHTFYDLQGLQDLGVSEIIIGAPLTHQLSKLKAAAQVPIHVTVNMAYEDLIPHKNGICGQWMRPEDMGFYSNYIDWADFKAKNKEQEQALFRIYVEQKNWPGDLSMIIDNLNYSATNRMIPMSLAASRADCGQRCLSGRACHLCERILSVANPDRLKEFTKFLKSEVD